MTKFDQELKRAYKTVLNEQIEPEKGDDKGISQAPPEDGGGSAIDKINDEKPEKGSDAQKAGDAEPMTPEGKRFLIELAYKALAIGPDQLGPDEKQIFNQPVTAQNADEMLEKLQSIVTSHEAVTGVN